MKTISEAIQRKGKELSDWSEAELREEYLLLARVLDLLESVENARPRRPTRMIPLSSLFPPRLRKETRGRKQDVSITNEELLELVQLGRDDGDRFATTTLTNYVEFVLDRAGLRQIGNVKPQVKRLQKRLSEARKAVPKIII